MLWAHKFQIDAASKSIIGPVSSVSENGLVAVAGTASLDALLAKRLGLIAFDFPYSVVVLVRAS